jgi:type IV secretory pathway VirB2 component (pilin)
MLKGKKTYVTAVVAVITAAAAYLTGEASVAQTGQLVFSALFAAFIRNGIK